MAEEFSKLMRDVNAREKEERAFKKLMLKKSREPLKVPKPQLAHGTFGLNAKGQLYKGAAKETKKAWGAHMRELMKP